MEQNNTISSSSSPSSLVAENVENKSSSFMSAIAGVLHTAASTIQHGLNLSSVTNDDNTSPSSSDSSSPSSSPILDEKESKDNNKNVLEQGKEILSFVSDKVADVVDTAKSSVASAVEIAEEKIIRPSLAVATASGALDKAEELYTNVTTEILKKDGGDITTNEDKGKVKEEGRVMSYSEYALEQFSRGGCTDKKLTMEMVAHIQRIADRTNDSVLHDMARKAHSAFAKGLHEAPGVHLTWITVEQANELVNLAIRTQDRALADFARYCQSVAATTQLGVEPFPGMILQELEKGRLDLAVQGRTHSGPGYGAAFSTVPRPQQQGMMTKSISATSIATTPTSTTTTPTSNNRPSALLIPTSPTHQQQMRTPPSFSPSSSSSAPQQPGMLKSYSTSNVLRSDRYGFGPSPPSISPPSSGHTSPTSSTTPTSTTPTSSSSRASFGTAPGGIIPKVYAPPTPTAAVPPKQQQQQQATTMQKSASAYYVPPSKAAAIANGYVPLSQRTPGMGMGMMRSASSARADVSSDSSSSSSINNKSFGHNSLTSAPTQAQVPVKKAMVKSFSTNTAAMPSVSTPIATDLKLTMDMVAHLQRIADRTGDAILHDTARKAHSACAKGLHEAPGVHLAKITPEQANELVNLAIRTQDHGLADFARYCQSVAATTQLGIEPSPGKIGQELAKGRLELAQQGRSYTGPGYGAAFASLNKTTMTGSTSSRDVSLKGKDSPKDSSSPSSSSPSSPSLSSPSSKSSETTAQVEETHDAQGQIKAESVKAEPFVPLLSSSSVVSQESLVQ